MNTNVIVLTTDWETETPELEEKASEVRLDAEVQGVIDKIGAIGTVEYNDVSLAKILEAEAAYAKLTATQKEQVSNYGTLLAARNAYNVLEADNEDTSALTVTDSGTINSTVKWYVYSNGLLEITGTGSIPSYTKSSTAPWYSYASSVKRILVRSSITGIGSHAFYGCNDLTKVTRPFVGSSRTATGPVSAFGYIFGTTYVEDASQSNYYIYDKASTTRNTNIAKSNGAKATDFVPSRVATENSSYSPYYSSASLNYAWYSCYDYNYSGSSYYLRTYYYSIPTTLKTVAITDATKIADGAFNNCKNITSITINSGLKSVGAYAFFNVPWYTNQTADFVIAGDGVLIKYNGTASGVTLPENVKYIGGTVF